MNFGANLASESMLVGADPEIFVRSDKELLPAFAFLPHRDSEHAARRFYAQSGRVYWDGFQGEFSFSGGQHCLQEFTTSIQNALYDMRIDARKVRENARFTLENAVKIPLRTLAAADDIHTALGCMPSTNAYGKFGIMVDHPERLRVRFSGGHIHLSPTRAFDHASLVQLMDAILGVWGVCVARNLDSPIRRKYYGLAGEYRSPKHGLEYRVLSNFWLAHPALTMLTFEIARLVVRLHLDGRKMWIADALEVQRVINKCDVEGALAILKANKECFEWLLGHRFFGNRACAVARAFEIAEYGLEKFIIPDRMEEYWQLHSRWPDPWKPTTWAQFSGSLR